MSNFWDEWPDWVESEEACAECDCGECEHYSMSDLSDCVGIMVNNNLFSIIGEVSDEVLH